MQKKNNKQTFGRYKKSSSEEDSPMNYGGYNPRPQAKPQYFEIDEKLESVSDFEADINPSKNANQIQKIDSNL